MTHFLDEYLWSCKEEFSIEKRFFEKRANNEMNKTTEAGEEELFNIALPSQGRQLFTRWSWSYPNKPGAKSKTFSIKYEKSLSSMDKIMLNNFQKKYLYHAMDDIFYLLKSKPIERENLLAILYSPVLSLQNNLSIDFFDIWIDQIYIRKVSKVNKFLTTNHSNFGPCSYITLKLVYTHKVLPKKIESFW